MSRLGRKVRAYGRVLPSGKRHRFDLVRWLVRRPALLVAVGGYEGALFVSGRIEDRLKHLAQPKTSPLTGCPF